jgi:hypothetical protein
VAGNPGNSEIAQAAERMQPDRFTLMSNALFAMFATTVRITYFFTCVAALAMTWNFLPGMWNTWFEARLPFLPPPGPGTLAWHVLWILVFGACPLRALWRLARRRPIVPDALVSERKGTAAFVGLTSLLGNLLLATVVYAVYSTFPYFDGNAAGPAMLGIMLYAVSLLCGELVLVGFQKR